MDTCTTTDTDSQGALVEIATVPSHTIPGQQISVRLGDGTAVVTVVPAGLRAGDTFQVAHSRALASASKECDVEEAELRRALQLSMENSSTSHPGPPKQISGNVAPDDLGNFATNVRKSHFSIRIVNYKVSIFNTDRFHKF